MSGGPAVYRAEAEVYGPEMFSGGRWGVPWAEAVATAERLVPGVVVVRARSGGWWRAANPWAPRAEWEGPGTIGLQLGSSLPVVLHECAHALVPAGPSHGADFQATLLRLTADELGEWWARRLAAALARHGARGHARAVARYRQGTS